ncbi:MAG: ARMT1-like domain-containing protein, partial [Candidatus Sabulitectum sp.]|nr:ARMT1-like domain-containing protein [Candidatus Sabulitectum sp.]
MKTYLECYPCFLKQALSAARRAGGTEEQQLSVIRKTMEILKKLDAGTIPPEIARLVHSTVRKEIFSSDPYQEAKQKSTEQALALLPDLRSLIDNSPEPMDTAIRLAIAGNIMDLGVMEDFGNLMETIERVLKQPFAIDHTTELKRLLETADHLLYLADNTGETVFDKALIERISIPVIYAVKGSPVLNDATEQDAIEAGLHEITTILSNGSDAPGTLLELCSAEFRDAFRNAPVIIAKGQGNYESLSNAG